jgi:hypothetical protein
LLFYSNIKIINFFKVLLFVENKERCKEDKIRSQHEYLKNERRQAAGKIREEERKNSK